MSMLAEDQAFRLDGCALGLTFRPTYYTSSCDISRRILLAFSG